MVLSTSIDGFTAGTPIEALTDDRNALLAVAMNGEPLPVEHGFPVRMVVPGLYGYVSATKWVVDLKVTTVRPPTGVLDAARLVRARADQDRPRGSTCRPAVARSRPAGSPWPGWPGPSTAASERSRSGSTTARGSRPGSPPSRPSTPGGSGSTSGTPPKGNHTLTVRAIDGTGALQTEQEAPPAPDGATGWHTITVTAG